MSSRSDIYLLEVHEELPKSWRVSDGGEVFYLPKSQVTTDEVNHSKRGNTLYEFEIEDWLAAEKGLI